MRLIDLQNAVKTHINKVNTALEKLPDDTAIDVVDLFEQWEPDKDLQSGQRLCYQNKLYRVIQSHHSQIDWPPNHTPALFVEVAKQNETPVWKQPAGAHDAYNTGDQVYYPDLSGYIWESTIDNNVWSPDVYGWKKL